MRGTVNHSRRVHRAVRRIDKTATPAHAPMPEPHPHIRTQRADPVRSVSLCVRAAWIRYPGMRLGATRLGTRAGSESGDGFPVCSAHLSLASTIRR
jgi:hypothetical protein